MDVLEATTLMTQKLDRLRELPYSELRALAEANVVDTSEDVGESERGINSRLIFAGTVSGVSTSG